MTNRILRNDEVTADIARQILAERRAYVESRMGDLNADRVGDALKEIDEVADGLVSSEKRTGMKDAKAIVEKHTGRTPAPTPKVETTGGCW